MRLRLALALSVLPVAAASYLIACGADPKEIEDLCGWIGDPNNCYRDLATDINGTTAQCGAFVDLATSLPPPNVTSPRHGTFLKRDKLELCVFDAATGGSVLFDPPLDLTQFPVTTASFTIKNKDGTACGMGSVGADGAFSVSIEPSPKVAEGATCDTTAQLCGGSFSVTSITDRQLIDTTCTSGETHRFNRLLLSKCDGDQAIEKDLDQLMPRAEVLSDPGNVGNNGYIRFRVYYPPAKAAEDEDLSGKEPVVVEYFECSIPGADPTCVNGIQDEGEVGVDCGAVCGSGCANGNLCDVNADCASRYCAKEAATGNVICQANPICSNGTLDPGEGDIDCASFCTTQCADCQSCNVNEDCASGLCIGNSCRANADAGCSMPDAGTDGG